MSSDGRGLDHLMEQNDTELDFAAYGGVDDGEKSDGAALLRPSSTLKAGGLRGFDGSRLHFDGGHAVAEANGCRFTPDRDAPAVGGERLDRPGVH